MSNETQNEKAGIDKDINIVIKTTEGDWTTPFPKNTKISDVIQAVVNHFKFADNGKYELFLETDTTTGLQPERNLISYGIEEGSVLVFTDLGIAV